MGASPPRDEKRSGNVGTWKGCSGIFSLCVNKVHDGPKQAVRMIVLISQGDRSLNGQEYEDEKTHVKQGGKLKNEALEELCILAEQQNAGQGNYQIITKVKKVKELVEERIPMFPIEEIAGKFAEDPDIQIHKKAI
jgi:hypothetical protein